MLDCRLSVRRGCLCLCQVLPRDRHEHNGMLHGHSNGFITMEDPVLRRVHGDIQADLVTLPQTRRRRLCGCGSIKRIWTPT